MAEDRPPRGMTGGDDRGRAPRMLLRRKRRARLLVARATVAAPAERTFHVEYAAAPGCPEEARFVEALLARASGAERVPAAEAVMRFRVELGQSVSTLWVELDEGRSRRVTLHPSAIARSALPASWGPTIPVRNFATPRPAIHVRPCKSARSRHGSPRTLRPACA
jgi:hypothetical protein